MNILKKYAPPIGLVAILVFIDQITKWLAVRHIAPVYPSTRPSDIHLIEGFLRLTYLENFGMAFGLAQGGRWIFLILTPIVLAALAYFYKTAPKNKLGMVYRWMILVIFGGALGNFIDRAFNEGGFVIDFIIFEFFPFVFNFADVFVVVGVIVFAIMTIFVIKDEPKNGLKFRKNK